MERVDQHLRSAGHHWQLGEADIAVLLSKAAADLEFSAEDLRLFKCNSLLQVCNPNCSFLSSDKIEWLAIQLTRPTRLVVYIELHVLMGMREEVWVSGDA